MLSFELRSNLAAKISILHGPTGKAELMLAIVTAAIPIFTEGGDKLTDLEEGFFAFRGFGVGRQHLVFGNVTVTTDCNNLYITTVG